jgi:hypothetical protein
LWGKKKTTFVGAYSVQRERERERERKGRREETII